MVCVCVFIHVHLTRNLLEMLKNQNNLTRFLPIQNYTLLFAFIILPVAPLLNQDVSLRPEISDL